VQLVVVLYCEAHLAHMNEHQVARGAPKHLEYLKKVRQGALWGLLPEDWDAEAGGGGAKSAKRARRESNAVGVDAEVVVPRLAAVGASSPRERKGGKRRASDQQQ
jgi:hypothetical protein